MKSFRKKIPGFSWHPFLFVSYTLLSLLVANQQRLAAAQILRPLLIICLLTGLLLLLSGWLAKDRHRGGLIATLFLLLFFSYGHVYGLLEGSQFVGIQIGRHRVLIVVFAILFTLGVLLVMRKKYNASGWTPWINLITLLLVIFQAVQLITATYRSQSLTFQMAGDEAVVSSSPIPLNIDTGEELPDIYFILLDTYTRQDAYQEFLGFDNSVFIGELRSRGFYIAGCSLSNYNSTSASVLASLDMLYLDDLIPPLKTGYRNLSFLDPYLLNNRVIATLKQVGYSIVAFESGYMPTEFPDADVYLVPGSGNPFTGGLTRYESLLLQSSVGILIYDFSDHLPAGIRYFLDATYITHRQRILYELDQLGNLDDIPGPKFVFAHVLAPHTPFVFTRDGQPVERNTPFTLNDDPELSDLVLYKQRFIDQTIFINQRILEVVDRILAIPGEPVIILQGDHGLPSSGAWRTTILNATYFPGGESVFYPTQTPVNTFRLIFNQLFDGGLLLSLDRSCRFNRNDPSICQLIPEPSVLCQP